eukprot:5752872-Amphidinium_carterae.1
MARLERNGQQAPEQTGVARPVDDFGSATSQPTQQELGQLRRAAGIPQQQGRAGRQVGLEMG